MGKRFTGAEIEQIQSLVSEGLRNSEIAEKLNRTEAAIRNIRYRSGLKTKTEHLLPELVRQRTGLEKEIAQGHQRRLYYLSENQRLKLESSRVSEILLLDQGRLRTRIQDELIQLKQEKPELFLITGQEQLARLTETLATSLIRYLTS